MMEQFKFPSITEEYTGEDISGENVYIFEKIDGGNVSIRREGPRIVPWSRGGPVGRGQKFYFSKYRQYVFSHLTPEIFNLPGTIVPFGEFIHKGYGHIDYGDANTHQLFLITVYHTKKRQFLNPEEGWNRIRGIGLHTKIKPQPLLHRGSVTKETIDRLLQQSSLYSGPPEGIVIHIYGEEYPNGIRMLKKYHPDFEEHDRTKEGPDAHMTLKRFIKAGQRLIVTKGSVSVEEIVHEAAMDVHKELAPHHPLEEVRVAAYAQRDLVEYRVMPLFVR